MNSQILSRKKHIDISYMFVREAQARGEISVVYVNTDDQLADVLTKALQRERFRLLRFNLGCVDSQQQLF